jgi:hypothetical protein
MLELLSFGAPGNVLQSSVVFGGGGMLMHFHSSTLADPFRAHLPSDRKFVELLVVSRSTPVA